ncbi:hypothetical protein ACLOJK_036577 [Asimina triloba]
MLQWAHLAHLARFRPIWPCSSFIPLVEGELGVCHASGRLVLELNACDCCHSRDFAGELLTVRTGGVLLAGVYGRRCYWLVSREGDAAMALSWQLLSMDHVHACC